MVRDAVIPSIVGFRAGRGLAGDAAVPGEGVELGELGVEEVARVEDGVVGDGVALHGVLLEGEEVDGWGEAEEGLVVARVEGVGHGDEAVLGTGWDWTGVRLGS